MTIWQQTDPTAHLPAGNHCSGPSLYWESVASSVAHESMICAQISASRACCQGCACNPNPKNPLTLTTSRSAARCAQVAACWQDHCEQMLTIRQIFLYLDRTYVISTSSVRSLFEMGLQLFGGHLARHPEVPPPETQP